MRFSGQLITALCLATTTGWAWADQVLPAPPELQSGYRSGLQPVHASRHMAAAANPLASEAGRAMLRAGGSAIDAAIAMQMVLTLVEPQSSGIGGGAFLLHWDGRRVQAFDGRETAPAAVDERLFLDAAGQPVAIPADRVVPASHAPAGLPIRQIRIPPPQPDPGSSS